MKESLHKDTLLYNMKYRLLNNFPFLINGLIISR